MARTSLADRRAADARGVDAIIPLPTESAATETEPASTNGKSEALSKVTIYIRPEQVLAVEEIQLEERKRTGKRKDKSELYQEAVDLLIQQYSKR